jgi:phosphoglycerate dehydrogenase-like enzyme
MKTILIALDTKQVNERMLDHIHAVAPDRRVVVTKDKDEILEYLKDIEVATGMFPRELLGSIPNLRWFQQWGAGADWLLKYPEHTFEKVIITNVSGIHAIPISEHILSYMFCFARSFHTAIPGQRARIWEPNREKPFFELHGKTVVLIGVGAIGSEFARKAVCLGMRVIGVRKTKEKQVEGISFMVGTERLLEVLPEADFVVLTVPLTKVTIGLIGEEAFQAMKRSAYIINVGRGKTIDEPALVKALEHGWIAGAGLDVFEEEPLPADSPLWDMEQVIVTPHSAGLTPEYDNRAWDIFLENLERYVKNKPLRNVVDQHNGY